jgi:Flp pilus assembly CpaE family ATPase
VPLSPPKTKQNNNNNNKKNSEMEKRRKGKRTVQHLKTNLSEISK